MRKIPSIRHITWCRILCCEITDDKKWWGKDFSKKCRPLLCCWPENHVECWEKSVNRGFQKMTHVEVDRNWKVNILWKSDESGPCGHRNLSDVFKIQYTSVFYCFILLRPKHLSDITESDILVFYQRTRNLVKYEPTHEPTVEEDSLFES